MKLSKLAITLSILCINFTTYAIAADIVAKEETTPPAAEGPLSADTIPPINGAAEVQPSSPSPAAQAPATQPVIAPPAPAPMTTDSTNLGPQSLTAAPKAQ
jgi:hypothetical protein